MRSDLSGNGVRSYCCVDTGIVIDNSDCSARWSALFPDRAAAEAMLLTLTEKAQQTASEPCEITSQFTSEPEGIRLNAESQHTGSGLFWIKFYCDIRHLATQ
ncbi:hypothetical protein CRX72_23515 [Pantoea sp. BRM17]|nr:hypothetical protein CRX72_23515 [Pantoea sp. BRM17]